MSKTLIEALETDDGAIVKKLIGKKTNEKQFKRTWLNPYFQSLHPPSDEDYYTGEFFDQLERSTDTLLSRLKEPDGGWLAPVCELFLYRLRLSARKDAAKLRKVKDLLDSTFRTCLMDSQAKKKQILLFLITELFRIHFALDTPLNCKSLIRSVTQSTFPDMESTFTLQRRVVFAYFYGKICVLEDDAQSALEQLEFAWGVLSKLKPSKLLVENNRRIVERNKKRIKSLLIPVRMGLGFKPTPTSLLREEADAHFGEIVSRVASGDVRGFVSALEGKRAFFYRQGVYLLVSRLKYVAYRQLFKTVIVLYAKTEGVTAPNKIHISKFYSSIREKGEAGVAEANLESFTRLLITNLIALKLIKGYLSFEQNTLVLSKELPVPKTSTCSLYFDI